MKIAIRLYWVLVLLSGPACSCFAAENNGTPAASVMKGSGTYELQLTSGEVLSRARIGYPLFPDDVALTRDDGLLSLLLSDESLIKLSRNSRLVLRQVAGNAQWQGGGAAAPGSRYQMQSGKLWFLNKNTSNEIEIDAPTVTAAIRGTEIQIEILEDTTTVISVLEGQVEASNPFGTLVVNAGQQAVAPPGAAPFLQVLVDPEEEVQWTAAIPNLFASGHFPLLGSDAAILAAEDSRLVGVLANTPADTASRIALARVRRDRGYPEEAVMLINGLATDGVETDETRVILGWSLLDSGTDPRDAITVFESVTGDDTLARLGLVIANLLLEDFSQAGTLVDDFLATGAGDGREAWFALARAWLDLYQGEITSARESLLALSTREPGIGEIWALLSMVDLLQLDNASALEHALQGTQVAPESAVNWLYLANVYQGLQDLPAAERAIRRAIELDDRDVTARYMLARIRFASDYTGDAIDITRQALAMEPGNADLHTLLGFMELARRNTGAAREAFSEALMLQPANAEAHLGESLALARQGDATSAIREISTAVLNAPRRALFRSYWAKILYEFRRHQQALDVLGIAQNIDPQDPTPFLYRALILRDLNRPLEALQALNTAIGLNDNRGVYRSRFLLDKDLAVKNVDLSLIYSSLNLGDWAQLKASRSAKLDYTNASAHLFLAGSYANDPNRSWARNSENLMARLLMPATSNTFNTFNDYTALVEKPGLQGNVEVQAGNFDTLNAGVVVFGSLPEQNLSFQAGYLDDRTDGWRDTNSSQSRSPVFFGKWSPDGKQNLMLVAAKSKVDRDGNFNNRFEFDSPEDPLNRFSADVSRFELGYHFHIRPGMDLLLHHADLESDTDLNSYSCLIATCTQDDFEYLVENFLFEQPFRLTQVQFISTWGNHQLLAGGNYLTGTDQLDFSIGVFTPDMEETLGQAVFEQVRRSSTAYLHDIWTVNDRLLVEAALYQDDYKTGNMISNTTREFTETSHRVGLLYELPAGLFARASTTEYVLPYFSDRLEPTDVAGIPVYRNGLPGITADEDQVQFGRQWQSGMAQAGVYELDRRSFENRAPAIEDISGWRASVNQLFYRERDSLAITPGFSLAASYEYQDIDSLGGTTLSRTEHRFEGGVTWTNQRGLFATLEQRYRDIDYTTATRGDESFWLTDIEVKYILPERKGILAFEINNLFDREVNWFTDNFVFSGRIPRREVLLTLTLNL